MKKHIIFLTLTALLAAFVAACNDNGTDDGGKDDAGELKPVVAPSNLRVENLQDMSAVLVWDGENSEYEVDLNGTKMLVTPSISFGIDSLTPETSYTWKVRAKEGERYSEWVDGPAFTTLELIDYTQGWVGNWKASNLKLTMMVGSMGLPVENFIPQSLLENVKVQIEKVGGEIDEVNIAVPALKELLPSFTGMKARVEDDVMNVVTTTLADTLRPTDESGEPLEFPLGFESLPDTIRNVIEDLGGSLLDSLQIDTMKITEMYVLTQDLSFNGTMKGEQIDMDFTIGGKFVFGINNDLINILLSLVRATVTFDAGMTLIPDPEATATASAVAPAAVTRQPVPPLRE